MSRPLPVGGGFARFVLVATTAVIAVLSFLFSFRNVWVLGDYLHVDAWIAPLVGPAVDLSVVGLLVTVQWLSLAGATREELRPARRLLYACGVVTLLLNSLPSAIQGWTTGDPRAYGRAAFEAIAPWLLIAWSHVGPWLLRLFADVRTRGAMVTDQTPVEVVTWSNPVDQTSDPVDLDVDPVEHTRDLFTTYGTPVDPAVDRKPDRVEVKPRQDTDLLDQFGDQLRDLHAIGKLSRYRVEQLTGASKNQALRLIDQILDQSNQTTELVTTR